MCDCMHVYMYVHHGAQVVKDPNRLEWGATNPNLFQLNSEQVSQEYSTLNHMGGQKALNHCNELTTDSEQYAKLNNDH